MSSTRTAAGMLLPSVAPRPRANAQTSTISAALAATTHTGSDTIPVKSRAVAHSPMRSSISARLQRPVWLRGAPLATLLGVAELRPLDRMAARARRSAHSVPPTPDYNAFALLRTLERRAQGRLLFC